MTTFHNAVTINSESLQETGYQTAFRFRMPQFKRMLHVYQCNEAGNSLDQDLDLDQEWIMILSSLDIK